MARNGSGSYTNPYPNFVAGTVISSDQVDSNNSDIATALTQSIAVDGQSTVTGNIPFNSKKITGLAVGAAATDSANLGQIQANAYAYCGTMGGGADAGTLSPTPAITAYAVGQKFFWKASTSANTGAMTVAISGLTTIAVQNDRAALAAGDHSASDIFMGILDTTSTMQIMRIANPEPLADNSVTLAKMASGVDGNIISYDSSGNPVAIATGNDGQVLTSAGAGAQPAFEDAGGGGGAWNLIGSATPSSGDTTAIVTGIDSTYSVYAIAVSDLVLDAPRPIHLNVGTSGGIINSGTDYAWQSQNSESGDTSYTAIAGSGVAYIQITNNASVAPSTLVYMTLYPKGAKFWGGWSSSEVGDVNGGQHFSAYGQSADLTIDRIQISLGGSSTFGSGRISVWGISHA